MSELFDVGVPAINKHISNIFGTEELKEDMVISKMEITTEHGAITGKTQTKLTNFYNLDMIIAVGYRVNSKAATKFRQWATDVLKDYIIKGYKLDKERLKNGPMFGKDYFRDLLAEINLKRMKKFYLEYKEHEIVPTPLAQLTWSHNMVLIDKIKDKEIREWYRNEAVNRNWSVVVLEHHIDMQLYERQAGVGKMITMFK